MLSATWYGCQDSDRLTWDEDEDGDEDEDDGDDDDDNDNTADYDVVIVHLMFAYNCDYYVLAMIRLFAVRCCWLLIISHAGEMVTRGQGSLLLFVCCLQFFSTCHQTTQPCVYEIYRTCKGVVYFPSQSGCIWKWDMPGDSYFP